MQERVGKMLRRASDSPIEYEVVLPSGYTVDLLVRPIDRTGRSQSHRPDSPGLAQGVDRPIAVEVRTRKDLRVVLLLRVRPPYHVVVIDRIPTTLVLNVATARVGGRPLALSQREPGAAR